MSFENVARQIVEDAVTSAVAIDDAFCEPYQDAGPNDEYERSKKLYESFREVGCVLDIYRYTNIDKWRVDKEILLNNKDLLILDWQLNGNRFKETLEILHHAIGTDSLPFVYIYTHLQDLDNILYQIQAYFSNASASDLEAKYRALVERLEESEEIDDVEAFLNDNEFQRLTKELLIKPSRKTEILTDICNYVESKSLVGRQSCGTLYQCLREVFKVDRHQDALRLLGFHLNRVALNESIVGSINAAKVEGEPYTFVLNQTLLKITRKENPDTENLYDDLATVVVKRPNNFLTLLNLELRSLYRKSSSKIAKHIVDIDEHAFFHHEINLGDKGLFREFLKDVSRDQVSAFLNYQEPTILGVLEDYKIARDISTTLDAFYQNAEYVTYLARLNQYYSILQLESHGRLIRFGDIFRMISSDDETFMLCITPHCDCIYPEKINHSLLFVSGNKISLRKGLLKGDRGFLSFLEVNHELSCIEWITKPFSLYIPPGSNNISNPIACHYLDDEVSLRYLASQKDNFTQRITNEAMNYAMRVGIDYAKLEKGITQCSGFTAQGKRCKRKVELPLKRCYQHK